MFRETIRHVRFSNASLLIREQPVPSDPCAMDLLIPTLIAIVSEWHDALTDKNPHLLVKELLL
jgi:hypothetical protein